MLKGLAKWNKPLALLIVSIVGVWITTLFKVSTWTLLDANWATLILEWMYEWLAASGIYGWFTSIASGDKATDNSSNPFNLQINE